MTCKDKKKTVQNIPVKFRQSLCAWQKKNTDGDLSIPSAQQKEVMKRWQASHVISI